jgi:dCMP deaminase
MDDAKRIIEVLDDKWISLMMSLAWNVSSWSKDPSTKVGAVVVDDDRRVVSVGYNGFPRDVSEDGGRYENRAVKYKMVVHAECNAILAAGSARGCALFTTLYPCSWCARMIIQSGVVAVYYGDDPRQADPSAYDWDDDATYSKIMLQEAGVHVARV